MKDGFLRVASVTPELVVADVDHNVKQIKKEMKAAAKKGASVIVFPELCITGYTCGDLFLQQKLLDTALKGLMKLAKASRKCESLVFVGLPFSFGGKLYNVAAALCKGEILGLVPKTNIPTYGEFYEGRYFTSGLKEADFVDFAGYGYEGEDTCVWFGTDMLFKASSLPDVVVACEICEDLWVPDPPSISHAMAGADIIVNLSASNELVGKNDYRRMLVSTQSARLYAAYIYASAGWEESTQDVVYSGHRLICENGRVLAEGDLFTFGATFADIDIGAIIARRRQMTTFPVAVKDSKRMEDYSEEEFEIEIRDLQLERYVDPHPFVPKDRDDLYKRCDDILTIQSVGLEKRLKHTGAKRAVVGISGGLDSTLALIVTTMAFDRAGLDRSGILGVTMPGFGTTDRTLDNAVSMMEELGVEIRTITIADAVRQHFADIGHDEDDRDVTYENSQARERTQILMDLANKVGALVIGTGDLSELALGWATYNGDHMSMYGVNGSVPKTLVRHLVRYYAKRKADKKLGEVLLDILDTPVSPELLPPEDGDIAQKTEELVGPYELHDFFLYYVVRFGFPPAKIYRLAKCAFGGQYADAVILRWEKNFYRRFFTQQFKRSCLPDGPKVGTVALSPRGDWRMPSDASARIWLDELEEIEV